MEQITQQRPESQVLEIVREGVYTLTLEATKRRDGTQVFTVTQNSPRFKYSRSWLFRTESHAREYVKELSDNNKARQEYKAKEKDANKARQSQFKALLQVGSILYTSWGHDQTNVEFYQVTKKEGCTVELRELAQERKETGRMSGQCVPVPDHFIERRREEEPIKIRRIGAGHIKISQCQTAWLWDGIKAAYYSSYA